MLGFSLFLLIPIAIAALVGAMVLVWVLGLRRVVPVNEVHIVQTRKDTVSYGKGFASNTYYEWPSRLPLTTLPLSVT